MNDHENASVTASSTDETDETLTADALNDSETNDSSDATDDSLADDSTSDEDDDGGPEPSEMVPIAKLRKANNEARNLRERLKVAESRIQALEGNDTDSSEFESRIVALTTSLRNERLKTSLSAQGSAQGAIEPSALASLVKADDVTWNDDAPTNVDELIESLKKAYPRLFAMTNGTGNIGSRSDTRGATEGLSPAERLKGAYKN